MILYIYGADTYRSRQYLRESVEQFKKQRDPLGYNVARLDGQTDDWGEILTALKSAPFLAEKRMAVIENILARQDEAGLETVAQWLKDKQIPESTVAIFWQGEAVGKSKAAKTLQTLLAKEKYAREFKALMGNALSQYVASEAAARRLLLTAEALGYILEQVGSDSWRLSATLNQLAAYAGAVAGGEAKEITAVVARLFVPASGNENAFAVVEAIAGGQTRRAVALLREQRARGEDEHKFFGLLVWQFRTLLSLADTLERSPGVSSAELSQILKIHPFVVKKNLGLAHREPLAALERRYRALGTIDKLIKHGRAPLATLLDLFAIGAI